MYKTNSIKISYFFQILTHSLLLTQLNNKFESIVIKWTSQMFLFVHRDPIRGKKEGKKNQITIKINVDKLL